MLPDSLRRGRQVYDQQDQWTREEHPSHTTTTTETQFYNSNIPDGPTLLTTITTETRYYSRGPPNEDRSDRLWLDTSRYQPYAHRSTSLQRNVDLPYYRPTRPKRRPAGGLKPVEGEPISFSCFNCDSIHHGVNACPEPPDDTRIAERRAAHRRTREVVTAMRREAAERRAGHSVNDNISPPNISTASPSVVAAAAPLAMPRGHETRGDSSASSAGAGSIEDMFVGIEASPAPTNAILEAATADHNAPADTVHLPSDLAGMCSTAWRR